ncbi:MAG: ArsR/SmtB family transcription factor [Gammaproteobacteria bacterium]
MADATAQRQVSVLAALAQATRLQILARVAEAGAKGVPAGEIARAVRCPASTLSFHLKELSRTGLLEGRARGRFIIYTLQRDALRELSRYLGGLAGAVPADKPRKAANRGKKSPAPADRSQLSIFGD